MQDPTFNTTNLMYNGSRSFDIMETVAKIKPIRLHNAQAKNLIEMCEKGIIPWAYHRFYKTLPIRGEGTNTEVTEEDSDSD